MTKQNNIPNIGDETFNKIIQVQNLFTDLIQERSSIGRPPNLNLSDVAVILIIQNQYGNQNLKKLYNELRDHYNTYFQLPCYKNFVLTLRRRTVELIGIVPEICKYYSLAGIKFIDSTPLPVCKIWREKSHKVMKLLARKSKSTTGWYHGLKLHLVSDKNGNPVFFRITTATVDDRIILAKAVSKTSNSIFIADAGYLNQQYQKIAIKRSNFIITPCRFNMKMLSTFWQNELMNMRSIIESVFSSLKTHYQLTSTLSRSINGYLSNYFRAIFRYCFRNIGNYDLIS